jgi:uncharacterized NAD(P)/FAD-binding protein YdhS
MHGYQGILELFETWDKQGEVIDFAEIVQALKRIDLERADLAGALMFANRNYRRIAIRRRPYYEALVLCWKSGQRSPIHNHAGSSCVVRVIEGCATETRFVSSPCGRLVPQWSRSFPAGTVTGCRDGGMIHQMANLGPPGHDLISLHVYSPPPLHWKYYTLDETTLADHDRLLREGTETVVVDFGPVVRGGLEVPGNGSFGSVGSIEAGPVIAIVGGGFSGAMVAVQLARQAGSNPPRIVLFEKTERLARGLAYGTHCDQHLLNVPAGLMSALPDEPTHFLDWLQTRDPSAQHGTFASRRVYGDYLEELLTSTAKASATRIDFVQDEVVDLEIGEGPKSAILLTRQGNRLAADKVVLALGHPMPQTPEGLEHPSVRGCYVANPWSAGALDGLEAEQPIALIGTGLTAVDLIVEARANGHRGVIHAISRHGLLPCCHRTSPATSQPHFRIPSETEATARSLLRRVRSEVALCQAQGSDWRSVVDALRPVTQTIWRSLGNSERSRFVRHLAPRWDVHRHRVAPHIDEMLQASRRDGTLVVVAGRIVSLAERDGSIEVSIRRRGEPMAESLLVRRVINCTGPARDVRVGPSNLLRSLIARGIGRPGPLALGLDVAASGALIRQDGYEHDQIFAIGPLLKERLWETTAVRELRTQTVELARNLLACPVVY